MVHIPHRNRSEAIYGPPGEPLEIGKHGRDEFLSARILRSQRSSKEIEKIAGLLGGFLPTCRRCGNQMGFQFILPKTQRPFIRPDVGPQPPKVGGLLAAIPRC